MAKYIIKRLIMCILVVFCASIIIFTIMYFVPGDPVEIMMGANASVEDKNLMREQMGLNKPYIVQLGNFLYNTFLKLDLGVSYTYNQPITAEMIKRFPRTLMIGVLCIIVDVIVSIPLGIQAALKQGKWQDRLSTIFAMACVSVPDFWFALMLVIIFSQKLKLLPSYGIGGPKYYIMPVMAGALAGIGGLLRQTRSGMLDVMKSDFVTTARAKGVEEKKVISKHMLPNALIPVITVIGGHFGRAVAGTVIIEQIFSIPGIGQYMLNAVNSRDYPVIRGGVVLLALTTSVIMLVVDLVYAMIDPRIKAQYAGKAGQ
ncbi:MAG: ABC transporter permease [Lachnospiraceae bacterium]|nr:ABC transporter permease [Lachnospiraceae bacterium]